MSDISPPAPPRVEVEVLAREVGFLPSIVRACGPSTKISRSMSSILMLSLARSALPASCNERCQNCVRRSDILRFDVERRAAGERRES